MLEALVDAEATAEGDVSAVPQELADAINALGQVLVHMTVEEVAADSPVQSAEAAANRARRLREVEAIRLAVDFSGRADRLREAAALKLSITPSGRRARRAREAEALKLAGI
jgi:hypothetical protein